MSNSTKSLRCNGSRASSAASRAVGVSARMTRSISDRHRPGNMCSVRYSPLPCAPSDLARAASSAVSAFARNASRRRESACVSSRSTAVRAVHRRVQVHGGHRGAAKREHAQGVVDDATAHVDWCLRRPSRCLSVSAASAVPVPPNTPTGSQDKTGHHEGDDDGDRFHPRAYLNIHEPAAGRAAQDTV